MNKEELLKRFLEGHPDSNHPFDADRFLEYAIACANEGCTTIDLETIRKSGKVSESMMHMYDRAYPWIRGTYTYTVKMMLDFLNNPTLLKNNEKEIKKINLYN